MRLRTLYQPAQWNGPKPVPRRNAASEYRAKAEQELSVIARRLKQGGHPAPTGDPMSGIFFLVEQPVGPRVLDALSLSLDAVNLPDSYVTVSSTGQLRRELLVCDPSLLVAVGPGAATEIDALEYPLANDSFSDATEGRPFAWRPGCRGLLLPSLKEALDDDAKKRAFWRAFLILKPSR